ncbi:phosphoinositide 3-kinase regulatory subunit 6 [Sparus aurata]|uniref:phosphoinositide 3-kinase regulatory subunit 6 n=1 Tax=Sparus aurata TaxID=8175 RepID=UPI0011C132E2|nr:phosphoinositide 3-kinase regulatory subunit 6-like [Sparus aurata]
MADPAGSPSSADLGPSTVESSLRNNLQALLKEVNGQSASQKGMLRWLVEKKLEGDPSCSVSLVRLLLQELEKKLEGVSKSGAMIPSSLYQTVYEHLINLLILPKPYSAVALSTLRRIKMEMITPGSLYQRRVTAEQRLKNELYTLQERVFVLADPAVFVRAHLEASSLLMNTATVERAAVLRVLQTGLGTTCQSSGLARVVEALEGHVVEKYFQEVVVAVEQSIQGGAGGRAKYLNRLHDIYRDILTASNEGGVTRRLARAYHSIRERGSKCLVLTKKLNLQLYYIPVTDVEAPLCPSVSYTESLNTTLSLASLLGRVDPWYNSRINSLSAAISKLGGTSEPSPQNLYLLDTLCYYLRCGTQPVNLLLYSVKMTRSSCNVTSVVEEVFVSHLEAELPQFRHLKEKSAKGPHARRKKSTADVFGAVMSVSYTKTSLSKRDVVKAKGEAPMACGAVITPELAAVATGKDNLNVRVDSVNPGHNKQIQTQNISIRTLEQRTLSVCLDRDSRRTYTDVQRIEMYPCLDPGCSIRSRFSFSSEREPPLSKYPVTANQHLHRCHHLRDVSCSHNMYQMYKWCEQLYTLLDQHHTVT